jgi:hypothetical protein
LFHAKILCTGYYCLIAVVEALRGCPSIQRLLIL